MVKKTKDQRKIKRMKGNAMSKILDSLFVGMQYVMPKKLLSRMTGKLASKDLGSLRLSIIKAFIKKYKVDMSEALIEDPEGYPTFNDFFTRALKPNARPIAEGDDVLVMPVDGKVSELGPIQEGRIIQAKGFDYSANTLLGGERAVSDVFKGGSFATIYLSPSDYHRIHIPCDAVLESMTFIPGDLFSVNPTTANAVPNLFARNERVSCIFKTPFGKMALVMVGATIVASIETVWSGIVAPSGNNIFKTDYSDSEISFKKGDEIGRFRLGSTVVLCFEKDAIAFNENMQPGTKTRLGEPMAVACSKKP